MPLRSRRGMLAQASVLSLLLLVPACGDDEPGSSEGPADAGADLTRDTRVQDTGTGGLDSGPDDTGDEAGVDTGADLADTSPEDEDTGPVDEICDNEIDDDEDGDIDCADSDCADVCEVCNDLVDNDRDGRIDCADPDCSDDDVCPEFCQNGKDDDADEDVDCDDSECASTMRCTEEPMPVETYEFREMGYFYRLQYPPEGVDCCFDYAGDEDPDNQLTSILSLIPDYDPQANMDFVVNQGDVAILLEWRDRPDDIETGGAVNFFIYRGVPTDPAPSPDPLTNVWDDGNGTFQIEPDSFDDRGPRIRFEGNTISEGTLVGGPHFLNLTVPIEELGLDLDLTVNQARIEADLIEVTDGDRTYLETVPDTSGEVTVGGGRLGGYIRADDLFGFLNEGAALCGCAMPAGAEGPLFDYGERPAPTSRYVASCTWDPLGPTDFGYACTDADSPMCSRLSEICLVVGAGLPFFLDVDSNKNQINESLSVGLFFDLTGAKLDTPPIAE